MSCTRDRIYITLITGEYLRLVCTESFMKVRPNLLFEEIRKKYHCGQLPMFKLKER